MRDTRQVRGPHSPRHMSHARGVGGVLEVVRPKVGAAEGRFGVGSGGRPPGTFCKKDTKSCVLGTSGTLLAQCACSRVEYSRLSPTADA